MALKSPPFCKVTIFFIMWMLHQKRKSRIVMNSVHVLTMYLSIFLGFYFLNLLYIWYKKKRQLNGLHLDGPGLVHWDVVLGGCILQHRSIVDDDEAAEGPSQWLDAIEDVKVLLAFGRNGRKGKSRLCSKRCFMIFWVRGHQNPPKSSKIPGFVVQLRVAEALGPPLILFLPLLIAGYKAKMLVDSAVLLGITCWLNPS